MTYNEITSNDKEGSMVSDIKPCDLKGAIQVISNINAFLSNESKINMTDNNINMNDKDFHRIHRYIFTDYSVKLFGGCRNNDIEQYKIDMPRIILVSVKIMHVVSNEWDWARLGIPLRQYCFAQILLK